MKVYSPNKSHGLGARAADDGSIDLASGNIVAVVKGDSGQDFAACRALWIGVGGNLRVLTDKDQDVLLKNCADGTMLPIRVKRVYSTNTTCTDILALY